MCGIVGFVSLRPSTETSAKAEFMRDALIIDTFRGEDSTGIITVCEDFDVAMTKNLGPGWDFVHSDDYRQMPVSESWAAIGHNRAATRGKIVKSNAHPFRFGPVTMVHNGTLTNMGRNLPNFDKKFEVDSMQIARALGKVPAEDAVEVLRKIEGAYALAWVDKRDNSINLTRNHQRPLHFATNTARSVLWFMSDGDHLTWLKKLKWAEAGLIGQVFQFGAHAHMKWRKGSLVPEVTEYRPFGQQTLLPANRNRKNGQPNQTSLRTPASSSAQSGRQASAPGWKPNKETVPARVPLSHRMLINGTVERIPQILIDNLWTIAELQPDMELLFEPDGWRANPQHYGAHDRDKDYGIAYGRVWLPEWESWWPAQLHNVGAQHANRVGQGPWRVWPAFVTAQGLDINLPGHDCVIVCRIKAFEATPKEVERLGPPKAQSPRPKRTEKSSAEDYDNDEEKVKGPRGELYSRSQWEGLVYFGCSNCGRELEFEDAHTVWWTGEREQDPICEPCVTVERMDNGELNELSESELQCGLHYGTINNYLH